MGNLGIISSIKKEYSKELGQTLATSLQDAGYNMFPNAFNGITTYKERNGKYRTGLDPNALYIQSMSEEDAKLEKIRVQALFDKLTEATGLDLTPTSSYYKNVFDSIDGDGSEVARFVKLQDGDNRFNLDNPYDEITMAWLRVHPSIAPSLTFARSGRSSLRCPIPSNCKFYVNDENQEAEVAYKKKLNLNKAINMLNDMNHTKMLKVAKLLGLSVKYNSKQEVIYNLIDNYLKDTSPKGTTNLSNFYDIVNMKDENVDIKFKIKEALDFNVYRYGKMKCIMEGDQIIAENEKELTEYFVNPKHNQEYVILLSKIDNAKSVNTE